MQRHTTDKSFTPHHLSTLVGADNKHKSRGRIVELDNMHTRLIGVSVCIVLDCRHRHFHLRVWDTCERTKTTCDKLSFVGQCTCIPSRACISNIFSIYTCLSRKTLPDIPAFNDIIHSCSCALKFFTHMPTHACPPAHAYSYVWVTIHTHPYIWYKRQRRVLYW